MPFLPISEYVKKKMCIYLLQRYLGQFFEEKLTLDQLSLDVYNGTGIVRNVSLDVQALNDLGEKQNWPMEFVDGYLEQLYVTVPWTSLLSDSSSVEVTGLKLTIQPKQRQESATSVFESMWSSMTSSMQLAKDYIKQEPDVGDDSKPLEGIEKFAQTIDSVLTRIRIKFIDTIIQIEHVPKDSLTGVAVQIRIGTIEYLDEAGSDPTAADEPLLQDQGKAFIVSSFTTKRLHLDNVTFHTVEFPSAARTFNRSFAVEKQQNRDVFDYMRPNRDMDSIDKLDNFDTSDLKHNDREAMDATEINERNSYRHEIIFGKLMGKQEIRIRLKQSENVTGSKVSMEVNLGGLLLFLTPRQVHILLDLANGISSPHIEDNSNIPPKQKCVEKPMNCMDYQRVEQDLQDQVHPNIEIVGLQGVCGWSQGLADADDVFHPMMTNAPYNRETSHNMYDSTISHASMTNSVESSLSSSMISSASEFTHSRRRNNVDTDPLAEITHFQIRIASLNVVLLHDDILSLTYNENDHSNSLLLSSVLLLKRNADSFFNALSGYNLTAYGGYQFEDSKQSFERACHLNHMRFIAVSIQVEGRESTTLSAFSFSGRLTVAKFELLECLYDDCNNITPSLIQPRPETTKRPETVQYIRLFHFSGENAVPLDTTTNNFRIKPCMKLSFKYEEKSGCAGRRKDNNIPSTELCLTLDTCYIDLDITIVDRINALLNSAPVCVNRNPENIWTTVTTSSAVESNSEARLDFNLNSPEITIILRFPVPDLRPKHDMNRRPWWQREVRADYLSLSMCNASVSTIYATTVLTRKCTMRFSQAVINYYETEDFVPVTLGKVTSTTEAGSDQWPSFEIEFRPEMTSCPEIDPDVDPMLQSTYPELNLNDSGPFSSTRVVHESDTPHAKLHQDDSEQLIIPGDRSEMTAFITETNASSRLAITMNLPTVYLNMESKHMYEVLYNRINSDLLLWESSAPSPQWSRSLERNFGNNDNCYGGSILDKHTSDSKGKEWFGKCKPGFQYESDSDNSSTDDLVPESKTLFESICESRPRSRLCSNLMSTSKSHLKEDEVGIKNTTSKQSVFTLYLLIGNGKVYFSPPARYKNLSILPDHKGELLFAVENGATLFSVSGYNGNTNLNYVCVQVTEAQLLHCDMMPSPTPDVARDKFVGRENSEMYPTIYKSDPGILADCKEDGRQRDMISLAVKIQANHETHYVKTVRVALGINKATLRHRMCLEPNTWLTQLIDFFNVMDYTIPGYTAKDVLTELHLHLWDCAIDYRPLNLRVWSVVTMESFSMSSLLSPKSNTSTLRFIAQECKLHLSDRIMIEGNADMSNKHVTVVHLIRDYIPVVEMRLFELSLRTNDKNSEINPHINLRASNNIVNIHTCSDSGRALIELMTYFAQDGDLTASSETDEKSQSSRATNDQSQMSDSNVAKDQMGETEELLATDFRPQNISKLSTSQHQQVNDMLGDAMKDCLASAMDSCSDIKLGEMGHGTQMFFFPDEGQMKLPEMGKLPELVTTDLGDVTFQRNNCNDTDDEFCVIGEDVSFAIKMMNNTMEIHWLTTSTLVIIDNYFAVPLSKTDVLKRPKSYPIPIMEYTLREMTVVWHMYGGYDFNTSPCTDDSVSDKSTSSKKVNFKDNRIDTNDIGSVAFTNARTGEVILPDLNLLEAETKDAKIKSGPNAGGFIRGGRARNTDVLIELQLNKVKFLHEVYPESGLQASRQVLAINDVEIRDRLKLSNINKFLYQYTSEARPKQSHAHMVIIKAAHIRPDQKLKTQECSLKVSLLPLRLNIDQDSLLFLITFFSELSGNTSNTGDEVTSKQNTPTHHPPVMTISNSNDKDIEKQVHKLVDDNLLILLEEDKNILDNLENKNCTREMEGSPSIYFRSIIFHPEVPIRLDYTGKRVDMSHGSLPGLLMGLGQLNCSELRLKRLSYRHGLLGIEKLVSHCLQEWLMEIKRHQLPSLLGGVGPMHFLIMLAQGVIDLVRLPIEQYQKDGRIVRGLQRGATSFTTSTAMAALELTSRLIHLIQITAETAYDMMSPGPSVRRRRQYVNHRGGQRRRRQPEDIRAGAVMAYNVFKQGIEETAVNIIRDASHEHEQKGVSGIVGGILRQIPPNVIVKPIILASEATNNLLGGVQNQLVPDAKREANEKWKGDDR